MEALVDTPVWSFILRRKRADLDPTQASMAQSLEALIRQNRAHLIGPVRQELLSGLREEAQFMRLRSLLRSLTDVALVTDDFEEAARMSNACQRKGVAGSSIDLLLCAVASRHDWPIFTNDGDFERYRRILSIKLFHT